MIFLVQCGINQPLNNLLVLIYPKLQIAFHISKRRKTALQLNRKETLKPGKKSAHVMINYYRWYPCRFGWKWKTSAMR